MNERIKELAEQSGLLFELGKNSPYPSAGITQESVAAYLKFAELIVKECATTVADVPFMYRDYRSQIEESMRNYCANAILNHFEI